MRAKRRTSSRYHPADLASEALAALFVRPVRTLLTASGTVLGIAALVATVGLARTAGVQIVGRFDELAATTVTVAPAPSFGGDETSRRADVLAWDVDDRLGRLNGVRAVAGLGEVDTGGALVRATPEPDRRTDQQVPVMASTAGLPAAVRGRVGSGRFFDAGHNARGERVAVLGAGAAARLGIDRVDHSPAVFIGEELYVVIGILTEVEREPDLLGAVIIPERTARARYGDMTPTKVVVDTAVGAARLIASQAAVALNPDDPGALAVTAPPEPRSTRAKVAGDADALFLLLGVVSLVVGAIGIANVTLVTVLERVGEIGLRRALGAARRHIAAQFLVESAAVGLAGGAIGTSLGLVIVVAVSATRQWTPVMAPWLGWLAPLVGLLVGLTAGAYPAWRASRLEPVEALRSGV